MFGQTVKTLLLVTIFSCASSLMASSLKVKKKSAKVFSEPKKSSKVLETLAKGDILSSEGRKGMYWKVKTAKGAVGFISILKVKRQADGGSKITEVLRKAAKDSRANGSNSSIRSRSAVMGVRGLDASEQVAFAGNMKPDFRLVYQMEDRFVSNQDVEALSDAVDSEIEARMK